ncbi:glyoxalase/bleomycin resistance/extradiol dioxygenase family protein [Labilibacter sediminis]|nr:glyoxalase/bleomycin resistance/extradiol dioxygenase family protein [Labilibacter sediminis]
MRIDHVAFWVRDLEKMRAFYQEFFGMSCGERYENSAKGFTSYFLSFKEGDRIEIMHKTDHQTKVDQSVLLGFTHLAISVGSKQRVDELTELIRSMGYEIIGEPRYTGDGYYESVISDPEGNHIEITE